MKPQVLLVFALLLFAPAFTQAQIDTLQAAKKLFENMVGKWELDKEASDFEGMENFMEYSIEYELLEVGVGVKGKLFWKFSNKNGSPISREGMIIMAYNGMDKKVHTLYWGDGPFSIAPSFELIDEKNFKAMAKNTEGQMGGDYFTIKENSITGKGFYLDSDGNEVADGITVMRKKE